MLKVQLSHALSRPRGAGPSGRLARGRRRSADPNPRRYLARADPTPEGLRVTALAAHLNVTQPTASDAAAALERKGLIEKRADPVDGRALVLRATRSGRATAQRWPPSFGVVIEALSPDDQAALRHRLARHHPAAKERRDLNPTHVPELSLFCAQPP